MFFLLLVGAVFLGAVEDVTEGAIDAGTILGLGVAAGLLALILAALARRRTTERRDREDDGLPSATAPPSPPPNRPVPPPAASPAPAPGRTPREMRSGRRGLETEPEDPAAQAFKARLADAVADLADKVEEMPEAGAGPRRLTSAEMVERAKRRIAEFGASDP